MIAEASHQQHQTLESAAVVCRWMKQVSNNFTSPVQLGCQPMPASTSPEAFTVQVLRSIDSRSALLSSAKADRLFNKKGRSVDRSIYLVRLAAAWL